MSNDLLDTLFQQITLTTALEERFGPGRIWPLRIRAAHAQLRHLEELLGETRYGTFLDCATRALDQHAASPEPRELPTAHLGRELYRTDIPGTLPESDVVWAVLFGLTMMLPHEEYESVVRAAAEAKARDAARSRTRIELD
ncbi:hypothetical protein QIS99_01400 [Streptomyces sp. B-S-A8]|uniref:Uncharacterized protein n=1 Tax=Streptomyces solicavernae TaxID=3043614 RepID=A0ABT6RMA8_9ACTN|nr:hypothetical protein [Streptomyces sp. B-S-A8]MDI3384878.1 hypothetical protein [Streptomyces sp. B-S-A8]